MSEPIPNHEREALQRFLDASPYKDRSWPLNRTVGGPNFTPMDITKLRRYLATDPEVARARQAENPLTDEELDAAIARFDSIDIPAEGQVIDLRG